MRKVEEVILSLISRFQRRAIRHGSAPQGRQVMVPAKVELPLPRTPQEEMLVPASINGRDLSSGRL
ncbi:hypothetical protein SAMN05880590_102128 [Rhizobium sp. RU35A]|uniref:Uncharacterized protein n=1 Tax=Rhizobium straminoryzae TaxID=1387186 RepID=A0A549TA80_9HYPH|nr:MULTISPECIES: hypothetical protein [Rhizobium]TRL38777.1 hypothetical protein FNA46_11455 [Rhizobium straminoryzae]SIQ12218.1 hypothetical protein SAMN05880590_102128 [Rhizobium sp. RU35A]